MFKVGDKIVRDGYAGHDRFGVVLEWGKAYTVASISCDATYLPLKEFPGVGQRWSTLLWSEAPKKSSTDLTQQRPRYQQGQAAPSMTSRLCGC